MFEQHTLSKNDTILQCFFFAAEKRAQIFVETRGETFLDDMAKLTKGWIEHGWTIEITGEID